MKKKDKIKLFLLLILIVGGIFLSQYLNIDLTQVFLKLQILSRSNPLLAIFIFIILALIVKLTFIPMASIAFLAGYLFGPWLGSFVAVFTLTLLSFLVFATARFLGADFVRRIPEEKFKKIIKYRKKIKKNTFITVLLFRLLPFFPLVAVDATFGFSGASLKSYLGATFLGVLPASILLANTGSRLLNKNDPYLYIFFFFYILFLSFSIFLSLKLKKNKKI